MLGAPGTANRRPVGVGFVKSGCPPIPGILPEGGDAPDSRARLRVGPAACMVSSKELDKCSKSSWSQWLLWPL
jgi:hypothetical protein